MAVTDNQIVLASDYKRVNEITTDGAALGAGWNGTFGDPDGITEANGPALFRKLVAAAQRILNLESDDFSFFDGAGTDLDLDQLFADGVLRGIMCQAMSVNGAWFVSTEISYQTNGGQRKIFLPDISMTALGTYLWSFELQHSVDR